jgi:hypothetical protein
LILVREDGTGVLRAETTDVQDDFALDLDLSQLKQSPDNVVSVLNRDLPEFNVGSIAVMDEGCGATWVFQAMKSGQGAGAPELLRGRLLPDGTIEEISRRPLASP